MTTTPPTGEKTNVRYLILAMTSSVTVFNYVDRATLSIAAR